MKFRVSWIHLKNIKFHLIGGPGVLFLLYVGWSWNQIPRSEEVRRKALGSDRVLLAQDGQILQSLRIEYNKRRLGWHSLSQFSEPLQEAVISIEDHRFYQHPGVDVIGLGRALQAILKGQRLQGASTITMQLSDLIEPQVLSGKETIKKGSFLHKLKQIVRSLILEFRWSKSEILEAYLNLIHLRGELQGVPAYSFAVFKKHPGALTFEEGLLIALQIASPNIKKERLLLRACRSLQLRIDSPTYKPSANCHLLQEMIETIFLTRPQIPPGENEAPHLARRLFQENPKENFLTSTLDAHLQNRVKDILNETIGRLRNDKVKDSAAIVIENQTGRVLAYVGAVATSESPHVDGIQSFRQAGSALKPFLYGKALDTKTVTAATVLLDEPTALSWDGFTYRPTNYDKQFSGPVSLREALASSLNVPAVKIVTVLGLHETYATLQDLGLRNLKEPDFYGVSMALGAVEVSLEDLANAYRMIANHGVWSPLQWILPLSETKGREERRVFSEASSFIISSILSDPNARAMGFGWESPLETPFWTAVKTGTSKDYRDNWCVGFSETYTVGVWAGNFDATAMEKVSGVTGAGSSWYSIMQELHRQRPSRPPTIPEDVKVGKIKHPWSSQPREEYFIKGTEPSTQKIEIVTDKKVEFIFPVNGASLIRDPHLDSKLVALAVRFKGEVPKGSLLYWDNKVLGPAVSPFIVHHPEAGSHTLSIRSLDSKILTRASFTINKKFP